MRLFAAVSTDRDRRSVDGAGTGIEPLDRSVLGSIVSRARPRDLCLIAIVPAVLLWISQLPPEIVDTWRLEVLQPTLSAAYLSHFVHGSSEHLLSNMLGYAILAPLAYALCLSAGRRREFLVSHVTFLVVFPFVLSALNVVLARPSVVYGYSGVVMALLGFLPLAVAWHVEARFAAPLDATHAPLGFFLGAAIIALVATPSSPPKLAAVGLATLGTVAYFRSAVAAAGGLTRLVSPIDVSRPGRVELTLAGVLVVVVLPLAAFPADPTRAGSVLNLYEHVLGYCLGFIGPFVTFLLVGRIEPRRDDGGITVESPG